MTVKAHETLAAAEPIARVLPQSATVLSFQNGVRNLTWLRQCLPNPVVGGVVSFNVVREGALRRQTISGTLLAGLPSGAAEADMRRLARVLDSVGERLELRRDIEEALAGKLLINLANGVAAATGLKTAELLRSRDARWCFAQCMFEGMRVMRASGLRPARVTLLPPGAMARALLLPDMFVAPLARAVASIDARARASTLQDLERGVPTEIDELNGAVVWLAEGAKLDAPANRVVTEAVHDVERGEPFVSAHELRERIERADHNKSRSGAISGRSTSRSASS
jgi:2-dehydropantoate 2-reductase